jgi:hypothetical protein
MKGKQGINSSQTFLYLFVILFNFCYFTLHNASGTVFSEY